MSTDTSEPLRVGVRPLDAVGDLDRLRALKREGAGDDAPDIADLATVGGALRLGAFDGAMRLAGVAEAGIEAEVWTVRALWVSPDARSRGVGAALVRALEARAEADGAKTVVLSLPVHSRRAIHFWRRQGYHVLGRVAADAGPLLRLERPLVAPRRVKSPIDQFLDPEGRLTAYPTKHADKAAALNMLAAKFEPDRRYTEAEVNEILKAWHTFQDWALLRRELFERGLLGRTRDGRLYWRAAAA